MQMITKWFINKIYQLDSDLIKRIDIYNTKLLPK